MGAGVRVDGVGGDVVGGVDWGFVRVVKSSWKKANSTQLKLGFVLSFATGNISYNFKNFGSTHIKCHNLSKFYSLD